MFVGGLVVEHGMDNPASRDLALNGVEKADEFAVAVTPHAAADDGTIEHAERREQAGRAVPLIVKRLDLALFVDRQHHGMGRGVDIERDDVGELGGKAGIARALEGARPMRLQLVQYARCTTLHRTQRNADGFGHRPAGPVGLPGAAAQCRSAPPRGDFGLLGRVPATQVRQSPIRRSGYPPRLNPSCASTARLTHHDDEWK